jgi:hypothetical protein
MAGSMSSRHALVLIAADKERDLALIGKVSEWNISNLTFFPYNLGHSEDLEWGSFVYMMGYQMITKGIISRPEPFSEDSFLVDAVANEGFSGSSVIAVKDGVPNFDDFWRFDLGHQVIFQ